MLERISRWLWKVLAKPMLDHIDTWAKYHADATTRRVCTEVERAERGIIHKMGNCISQCTASSALELSRMEKRLTVIEGMLGQYADFRQFEAVSFAAEKMVLDQDFWRSATEDQRITKIEDWAKIYANKNNWALPDGPRLRGMVCAKMEQIRERRVGPTQ